MRAKAQIATALTGTRSGQDLDKWSKACHGARNAPLAIAIGGRPFL